MEGLEEVEEGDGVITVEVMSPEQTSQIYLSPPSVPRVTVFLRMTPMIALRNEADEDKKVWSRRARIDLKEGALGVLSACSERVTYNTAESS